MIDYRSKLLGYTNKPQQRVDEWTLINKQKSLEEQQAKLYQMKLAEQKRKKLKQDLDRQVWEKNNKQQYFRKQDMYYGEIMEKQAKEAKYLEERKRNQLKEKRREMEQKNIELFNGIVESKFRESLMPTHNFIDIGVKNQLERKMMTENQKKEMIDELDRQIRVKQQQKYDSKRIQLEHDQANINYQMSKLSLMGVKHRSPGQSPYVYDYYQRIVEHEKQKERQYEKIHIKEAQKQKQVEDLQKVHEQNMNKKYLNYQMKNVLEQQVKVKAYKKQEQSKVNPEQLTYGTIGDMLNRNRPSPNKQQYFLDLKKQIQQKQKKQEQQRYMSDQQYKINLNHLNRAFEGNYASRGYLDRSIHALSDSHKIQQSAIDAHLELSPQSEAARKKIEQLKGRSRSRLSQSLNV